MARRQAALPQPSSTGEVVFTSTPLNEVTPTTPVYSWPGWFIRGRLIAFVGIEGVGKSTTLARICDWATNGTWPRVPDWPAGDIDTSPVNVLIVGTEESISEDVVRRLQGAGADMSRVSYFHLDEVRTDKRKLATEFTIEKYVDQLQALIIEEDISIVVFDPVKQFTVAEPNSEQEVREALLMLNSVVNATGATICTVLHLNKRTEGELRERVAGSYAWVAVPRTVLMISPDPAADEEAKSNPHDRPCVLSVQKSNMLKPEHPMRFRLRGKQVPRGDDSPNALTKHISVPVADGFEEATDLTHSDCLEVTPSSGTRNGKPKQGDRAHDAIISYLAPGPQPSEKVVKHCEGLKISRPTVYRAASKLGLPGGRGQRNAVWELPPGALNGRGTFAAEHKRKLVDIRSARRKRQGG